MADRLIPRTHIIKSIRSRTGQSLAGSLHEFCDNSIGHGRASTVYITIDREQIVVRDDGAGTDDINRIFSLGDTSSYETFSEIGQYGIGATDSAIFLGDELFVETAREGQSHRMGVDWTRVERTGEWPERYKERGEPFSNLTDFPLAQGTKVVISKLHKRWTAPTSEKLSEHLELAFMPALREGIRIHLTHMDRGGVRVSKWLEPFEPPKLRDETEISGEINTRMGTVTWHGRAGLSDELTDRQNSVFIVFGHRVIEKTEDPFQGQSAPTLYAEVQLSQDGPAKYMLSDKKDRIINFRKELMESINVALTDLIEKAREEGHHLRLFNISVPLQDRLTKALQGNGWVFVNPDDPGEYEPEVGPRPDGLENGRLKPIQLEGATATEKKPPTGVEILWTTLEKLEGKPYDVKYSKYGVVVMLAEEYYDGVIDWPPKQRDQRIIELILTMVARGIEIAYATGDRDVLMVLKPKLRQRVELWSEDNEIAPRLQAELQARV